MDKYNSLLRAICLFLLSYIFGVLVYEYIHKGTPSAIDVYRGRFGYAPNLYYFDQEWHVSWIDSAEGDCLCDFVGKSPEEAIINAHRSIIITDNSIKFL